MADEQSETKDGMEFPIYYNGSLDELNSREDVGTTFKFVKGRFHSHYGVEATVEDFWNKVDGGLRDDNFDGLVNVKTTTIPLDLRRGTGDNKKTKLYGDVEGTPVVRVDRKV